MFLLDLIFPPTCEYCKKVGKYVCNNCCKKIVSLELKKNEKNDKFFMYKYDGEIRELILKYKFRDKSYLCNFFAEKICECEEAVKFIKNYDVIVPVPLHKKRLLERGYNQTYEVAKLIVKNLNYNNKKIDKSQYIASKKLAQNENNNGAYNNNQNMRDMYYKDGANRSICNNTKPQQLEENKIKCVNNVLKKVKNIKPQSLQDKKNRENNVKNVFRVENAKIIMNKNVLIFDDIYTTGSTACECKKVLLKAGAKKCGIMTIARDFID